MGYKSPSIVQQRCHNHAQREAAGRCVACQQLYCRECVSEFEGRLFCAACLRATQSPTHRAWSWGIVAMPFQLLCGVLILWLLFYGLGAMLLATPSAYHALESQWPSIAPESAAASEEDDAS